MVLYDIHNTLKVTLDKTCDRITENDGVIFYGHDGENVFLHEPENGALRISIYPAGTKSFIPELAISLGLSCVRSEASGLTTFEMRGD